MPFEYNKYNAPDGNAFSDPSDALANSGFVIIFTHLITGKEVAFKAFINAFTDTYSPDWTPETVYGRADPIYTFKNTTRKISLTFEAPASSTGEAYEILAKAQTLVQFLYPAYTDVQSATTIAQSSLIRLKVMNLLTKNTISNGAQQDPKDIYTSYSGGGEGLLGIIDNVTVNHNISDSDLGIFFKDSGVILPKKVDININFSPIHEHSLGWQADTNGDYSFAEGNSFPYNAVQANNVNEEASEPAFPSEPASDDAGETAEEELIDALLSGDSSLLRGSPRSGPY